MVIQFPDGSREFRYPSQELKEGDRVWHDGKPFRVLAIASEKKRLTATVELESDELGDLLQSERGGIVLDELVV